MDGNRLAFVLKTYPYAEILYPLEPLLVQLNEDNRSFFLSISRDEILFQAGDERECDIILSGSRTAMDEVLEGKRKLMKAIRIKRVEATGSYRRLLLLESILWLANKS
ncbi:SCP2 sterol-binding domain-containing protein [Fervidibacillus albus]|uniref:SCP2 sterol-binding domain-containing protein n=1 Tax=Fervidibacillus albus TaxID=2980026 RepID=A0A9E8LUP4_9BACI|nr:SCP2 sterol-binding domain-containing protein [Fervidibacillus albus]WAA09934.1 SCP2 sterol-binding domain-containing protein [Fervidibacillus albus]